MKQKSLKRNAALNFIKALMNIIFPIISFPYASRILMPEGIGKVNFANSIIEYFVLIASLGITAYATREAAKLNDDKQKLSNFARDILTLSAFSTLAAYIALTISFLFIPKFNEYRLLIIICSTKILFTAPGVEWLFRAKEEYGYITIRQTIFQILSLAILFIFVREKEDYYIYAAIGVFSNVGANLFNFIHSQKYINILKGAKISIKKHLKPIFIFFGIDCAGKINSALDAVMLGFLIGDTAVGLYSAAIKINRMVVELITSALSSFMPRSSYYIENGNNKEYETMIEQVCNATFFFSIPAAAGLFFLCKPLIILFSGDSYLPAIPSMQILSFSIIGSCTNSFLNNVIITPQKKEKFSLISQILAAITNIILNIFLIRKLNVFGASIATTIVEFLLPIVILIPSWKYVASQHNMKGILKTLICTISMYFILHIFLKDIENNIIKITFSVFLGSISYAIFTLVLKHPTAFLLINGFKKKIKSSTIE